MESAATRRLNHWWCGREDSPAKKLWLTLHRLGDGGKAAAMLGQRPQFLQPLQGGERGVPVVQNVGRDSHGAEARPPCRPPQCGTSRRARIRPGIIWRISLIDPPCPGADVKVIDALHMRARRYLQRPATCRISMANTGTAPAKLFVDVAVTPNAP